MWLFDYKSETDNPYHVEPFVQIRHIAYVDNSPKWEYPRHFHDQEYEVTLILSGSGILNIVDTPYEIEAGTVVVIPANVYHRFCGDEVHGMRYCNFRFLEDDSQGEVIRFFREKGPMIIPAGHSADALKQQMQLVFDLHRSNGGRVDGMMQSILLGVLQWICYLAQYDTVTYCQIRTQSEFGDILNYIEYNREKRITLDSLSYQFGISTSQLNRVFRKSYNTTPINYLINCRLAYATEYLLKNDYSIAEISSRVGYDNPNHFVNMFSQRIGCSPDEYRRSNRDCPRRIE